MAGGRTLGALGVLLALAAWPPSGFALAEDRAEIRMMNPAPVPDRVREPARNAVPGLPEGRDAAVSVRVRFSFQLPLDGLDPGSAARAQERGRGLITRMVEEECDVLRATIAETCTMSGVNFRSRVGASRRGGPGFLGVGGSARYTITLKDEPGRDDARASPRP
jgi:hypothetical protein